jgi:choline dehydrogenase-like flavoprotein
MTHRHIGVVGSGPSGMAAAWNLAAAGHDVTVIDVGLEIEPELAPLTEMIPPVDRDKVLDAVATRRGAPLPQQSDLPPKLPFGSDFVYRKIPASELVQDDKLDIKTSLALGGLSNSWGANVCALAERDMTGWPLSADDLAPYYQQLENILDISGDSGDAIDLLYPVSLPAKPHYPLSHHGRRILANVTRERERLVGSGLHCGRAKLAVGPKYSVAGVGCVSCGLCMHGCPHRAIFNGADVMRQLLLRQNVRYLKNRFVLKFFEHPDCVKVTCRFLPTGTLEEHKFTNLIVACGVFGSTAVVARSLNWCDLEFVVRDSQKYYFPYVCYQRAPGALTERVNTLAQIFIQDIGLKTTPHTVQCQLYGVNDLFFEALSKKFGPLAHLATILGTPLWERTMIGMVYLHSNDSITLRFRVSRNEEGPLGKVEAGPTRSTRPIFREFMGRLRNFSSVFGGRPLGFMAQPSPPGHSLHFGGSLPMSRTPRRGETDILGRPFGCRRVHVVDASVFPSIPGTPTTYAVMANSLRISGNLDV